MAVAEEFEPRPAFTVIAAKWDGRIETEQMLMDWVEKSPGQRLFFENETNLVLHTLNVSTEDILEGFWVVKNRRDNRLEVLDEETLLLKYRKVNHGTPQ